MIFIKTRAIAWLKLSCLSLILPMVFSTTSLAIDVIGSSKTNARVTPAGAFNYRINIELPVGTNDRHPNLGLDFSSSRSDGSLGVGWGLFGLTSNPHGHVPGVTNSDGTPWLPLNK